MKMKRLLSGLTIVSLPAIIFVFHSNGFAQTASEKTAGGVVPVLAASHKVQVSDPATARRIVAKGGRMLADYGGYQLYAVETITPDLVGEAKAEVRDDFDRIELNAGTITTTGPVAQALRKPVGAFKGRHMHLVQFIGPVQPAWHAALAATGVRIVCYIPQNAYLVFGDADSLARVQKLAAATDFIQWENPYTAANKVHPGARPVGANGQPRQIGTDLFEIQLVADDAINPDTLKLIDALKLAPIRRQSKRLNYVNLVVRVAPTSLDQIAAQPDVVSIQPYVEPQLMCERQDQIVAGNLTGNLPSGPGYLAWLASKGFTQSQFTTSGFAVDLTDSGIDNATTTPYHFGLYVAGNTNAASRVIYNRLEGVPNPGSTLKGCDGHGTINSHIICGFNDLAGFPHTDGSGFHYGLGVCPFVKVGSSVIFDPNSFTFPNYANLLSEAYHDGARLDSDSWGANTFGAYNSDSQQYDALVRDAQPSGSTYPVAGNQEMVVVFAAGNAGSGAQSVGSPGTAKNVITVGAANNVQPFGGSDYNCGIGDSDADSANDIVYFSSRGPCSDGRTKPDIVGPGTHVSGGVVQTVNPGPTGTADGCFNGSGVCGGVGSLFYPAGQQFFTASSGTSHSTPCVAGGCALLRQYFINNGWNAPSPAMTKAYLMNAARYMNGSGANDSLWSNNQGMGEMNLGFTFDGTSRLLWDELTNDLFTASGQTRTYVGLITDPTKPFRVTLAWTDAPGSTVGNAYNNNLDLTVAIGGGVYKGNVFSGASSVTGGTADSKNNVESVFLTAGVSGVFTVTVTAVNINSDGVPNNGNPLDQDFALVVYNAMSQHLTVSVPANATEGNGVLVGQGLVTAWPSPTNDLTVALSSSNTGKVVVPPAVTIPTGQTNTTFNVTIVNNTVLDGTQSATITAATPGYVSGSATMDVYDNETATLTLTSPATATKGQGILNNAGTVFVSAPPASDVAVNLTSGNTNEILLPPTVMVPAGHTSNTFNIVVVDNHLIEGPQAVTLTAHVQNWTDGSAVITVHDNTNLTVTLPVSAYEGDGVLVNAGVVAIAGTRPTSLLVNLSSGNTGKVMVPSSVTITAGQTSAVFNVTIVDNLLTDGAQPATVTASAAGFANGNATIAVLDNDLAHFTMAPITSPQRAGVPFTVALGALDVNGATIGVYHSSVALSAAGDGGPVAIAPTNTGPFVSGVWTGAVSVNNLGSNVRLTADDGAGHSVTSAPFNVVVGPVHHFVWNPVPTPQHEDVPFPVTVIAQDIVNNTATDFTGTVALRGFTGTPEPNQLATFDDLPGGDTPVPAGYEGLTWNNFYYLNGVNYYNSGYQAGTVSPSNVTYNAFGSPASIVSPAPMDFTSAYLTAAWNDDLQVEVKGYTGATLTYDNTYTLSAVTPTLISFNYLGVTEVDFISFGGTPHPGYGGGGTHFVMDNVVVGGGGTDPVSITPTNSGPFVTGVWTGSIAVLEAMTNVHLRADDAALHSGTSTPFDVQATVDLGVSLIAAPNPVPAGNNLIYVATIVNSGPDKASRVDLTDPLPTTVAFVSAAVSQGTCTQSAAGVTCSLGNLSSGALALAIITVTPPIEMILTNTVTVSTSGTDTNLSSNTATAITVVQGSGVLQVAPGAGLDFTGPMGGPFGPSSQVYTLTNSGTGSLSWSVTNTANWVGLSQISGTLPPHSATDLIVSINGTANTLPVGSHTDTITFTNLTNGNGSTDRSVTLTIVSPLESGGSVVSGGNGNGRIDPNECGALYLIVHNGSASTVTAINATLSTTTPGLVVAQASSPYPDLLPGQSASNALPFAISTAPGFVCGTAANLVLSLAYAGGTGTNVFNLPSGGNDYTISQSSGAAIIPGTADTGNHCDDCVTPITLPFPYTFYGQTYSNATVSSNGNLEFGSVNASYINDCLPQSGFGPTVFAHWDDLYTSDGTSGQGIFTSVSGSAPNRIFNIEWRTRFCCSSGAPDSNFEIRLYEGEQRLDVIYGSVANSGFGATVGIQGNTTSQFTQFECNAGGLTDGLQLTFQILGCTDGGGECADIAVGQSAVPDPVDAECDLVYTVTATNKLATTVTGVTLSNTLPTGVTFVSAVPNQGTCTNIGGTVVCDLGTLPGLSSASANITVQPWLLEGTHPLTNVATAVQSQPDMDEADNTASAVVTVVAVDTDHDGMPDCWELRNGLDPNNPADATADSDGDGLGNAKEYLAGTNPHDGASRFRILTYAHGADGFHISFATVFGKLYLVERTDDLGTGIWMKFGGAIAGTGGIVTVIDPTATGVSKRFYRVRLVSAADTDGDGLPDAWEIQHFGSIDAPNAGPNDDPDGDGLSNLQELLAGTDPADSDSAFRITAITRQGNDIHVTWMMGNGKTNALQRTAGGAGGSYRTNDFADIFTITNTTGSVANHVDPNAATNTPSLYYRVRLVP